MHKKTSVQCTIAVFSFSTFLQELSLHKVKDAQQGQSHFEIVFEFFQNFKLISNWGCYYLRLYSTHSSF